ncbi:unnamed protein product [Zymoseptoria tritici ST99CH_1E4]|uniref:rRNA methyltransferase 1, mitochondrial n=2 Tax=Zymoseptoria tritici TaxID=1047171 RepID=A0A2H1FK40_ZYMTR|nr:unnamed protein product [Zymoseptoria tritici ST99CH_1E4]
MDTVANQDLLPDLHERRTIFHLISAKILAMSGQSAGDHLDLSLGLVSMPLAMEIRAEVQGDESLQGAREEILTQVRKDSFPNVVDGSLATGIEALEVGVIETLAQNGQTSQAIEKESSRKGEKGLQDAATSSYRKDGVPSSGNERAVSAPAVESTEESAGARNGLLRDIKTACKLIRSIQKSEASGEDTSELINMTIASLRSVNKHVTSGKFQDEPSEAIASLFEKKAFAGTFIDIADAASSNASVLFQRGDGKIELAARRRDSATPHSRRTATKLDSRKEYEERSPEVTRDGRAGPRVKESRNSRNSESREEDGNDGIPVSIPYTTAASEFIYGKNAVFAALKAQRRKLYNLYVHPNIIEREASGNTGRSAKSRYAKPEHEFTTLAKNANVPFRNEYKAFLLDKMSDGRPHNGVVLEASKLPAPPILALGKPDIRKSAIPLVVGTQSVEELVVNGGAESISVSTNSWRHPFVVLLDGILDPVNVGSIMRTCHFYGADAVAVATNTCAPLASGVLAKASSGACEAVQILSLPKPSNFVHDSAKAGWKIYAAVAPEAGAPSRDAKRQLTTAAVAAASPLADHPCILMLGAEGEGLRENLKNRADAFVSIERGPNNAPDVGVDSMNVGVAAGVLMEAFLRKPAEAPEKIDTTSELGF